MQKCYLLIFVKCNTVEEINVIYYYEAKLLHFIFLITFKNLDLNAEEKRMSGIRSGELLMIFTKTAKGIATKPPKQIMKKHV